MKKTTWNPMAAPLRRFRCYAKHGHGRMGIRWVDWLPNGEAHCQECGGRLVQEDRRHGPKRST